MVLEFFCIIWSVLFHKDAMFFWPVISAKKGVSKSWKRELKLQNIIRTIYLESGNTHLFLENTVFSRSNDNKLFENDCLQKLKEFKCLKHAYSL